MSSHGPFLLLGAAAAIGFCACAPLRADAPPETVDVRAAAGPVRSGRLLALDANRVVLDAGMVGELTLPTRDVLSIRFPSIPQRSGALPAWCLFPNGDRAALEVLRMEDESFVCRWRSFPGWEPLRVPLESVSGLIVHPPASRAALRFLVQELSRGPFASDVLILSNRDRLSGELRSASPEHYELSTLVGPVQAAAPQVLAIALDSSLVSLPAAAAGAVLAMLTDGSWLSVVELRLEDSSALSAKTLFGAAVTFPRSAVAVLLFCGPRVTFVSTLPPASSETRPYLSAAVPTRLMRNRNVRGGFLALRGRELPRGVGVASASRTTYALGREYESFQATIGIDDEAEGGGSAVFAVDLDARRVFTSPLVTGRSQPIEVGPLDVRQADELTLVVEYGEYGDIRDYADWGNAVLVRSAD